MQGLCRIFASNPTHRNARRISEIRGECRFLCRVCRIFISPLFMYVGAACRCIFFMTSFSGAPLRPQSSLHCYSVAFFVLLFRSLFRLVIPQPFRTVIPQSSLHRYVRSLLRTVIPQSFSSCYSAVFFVLLFRHLPQSLR